MKKLSLIFLLIPCAILAQDTKVLTTQDALINVVLESTANYLEHKNQKQITPLAINPNKRDPINWGKSSLNRWEIIEPKDSLKIINHD
jgi:hypothetical protein